MIKVYTFPNESVRSLLRRFKKQCEKENLIKELRKREYYLSPSEKAKRKDLNKIKNVQKERFESRRGEKF